VTRSRSTTAAATARRILELLRSDDATTTNTSMRIPTVIRDAAALAVSGLHVAESTTALTTDALRAALEAVAMQATLDAHYAAHPELRPTLAERAIAAAELDGHPLAAQPHVLTRAAAQIAQHHPEADGDDVVLWAEAQQLAAS
jgi:hypothetical protein